MKYISASPSQTKKIGENLAKKLLKIPRERALIIGLEGDLGGGKTTFLQGFARGLGIKKKILSPTFVIMKKFQIPRANREMTTKSRYFYHIDCYRIKNPKEILTLGFKEIISGPEDIVVIEWADRIEEVIPREAFRISFKFVNQSTRKITINSKFKAQNSKLQLKS